MTPERWRQVDEIFHSALACEPGLRTSFLTQACAGDVSLLKEVESLISFHEDSTSFIQKPASDIAAEFFARGLTRLAEGQMINRYRITGLLGAGGMGEVYLAEDIRLGRRIALKLLPARFTNDKDRLRRFQQEARTASALNHPNILTVHEIELDGELNYIATEFIDGRTLTQQMAEQPLSLKQTIDVAIQLASALDAAHTAGIVHRDIKPDNVMLRSDGYVKILDFGLAKLTERPASEFDPGAAESAVTTNPGIVLGTPRYMSPEQARGLEVDARADIFSLGVMIYEMVAGRPPFDGATMNDVIAALLKDEAEPLRNYAAEAPFELESAVQKALTKNRAGRYQTARELASDLQRIKEEVALSANLGRVTPAAIRDKDREHAFDEKKTQAVTQRLEVRKTAIVRYRRSVIVGLAVASLFAIAILSAEYVRGTKEKALPSKSANPQSRPITIRSGHITAARFAPDGKTIIYSAGFDGLPLELFSTDIEGAESHGLGIGPAGIKSVSSKGQLAVLLNPELNWNISSNGTLALVPLTGGTPQVLQERVDEAEWAPDGETLLIVRTEAGKHQLEYPSGNVQYRSSGWISCPRLSPKGDKIAFLEHPIGNYSGSVAVTDLTTKTTSVISTDWRALKGLAWSLSGDEIWFGGSKVGKKAIIQAVSLSGRERTIYDASSYCRLDDISSDGRVLASIGNSHTHMVVRSAGATTEATMTPFAWSTSADLSADGKTLLFYEWGYDVESPSVYLRKLDGSEAVRLGEGRALALSPDGSRALALLERSPQQLVVMPTNGDSPRMFPNQDIKEYHSASWFPDGRKVLFTALGTEENAWLRSYVLDTESGETRPITDDLAVALRVAPDGNRIVVWQPDGYYVQRLDGTAQAPIPGLDSNDYEPIQWSDNGRALFVLGPGDFDTTIFRVDIATGRRRLWQKINPSNRVGLIGLELKPGGILITPDGKSSVYTYWTANQELMVIEGLK